MKKRTLILMILMLLMAVPLFSTMAAADENDPGAGEGKMMDVWTLQSATAPYVRVEAAEEDGYIQLFDCIDHPEDISKGAMGIHYLHPERLDDQLELEKPEVLVYEPQANGRLKLVAVEYIIPEATWSGGAEAPVFLGQQLKYKTTMGRYGEADGINPYYEVHVWAWDYNPSGLFSDWNPDISCPSVGGASSPSSFSGDDAYDPAAGGF